MSLTELEGLVKAEELHWGRAMTFAHAWDAAERRGYLPEPERRRFRRKVKLHWRFHDTVSKILDQEV